MAEWRGTRASMLVVVIMVTLVLLMLVMVVGSNTIENMRATTAVTDKREARYAAFAGLQRALVELQRTPSWTAGFTDVPMPDKTNLCYTVTVRNNLMGTLNQAGVPPAQQVPPKSVMLDAMAGDKYDPTKPLKAITGLTGLAVPRNAVFQQAAFTDSSIAMNSNSVTEAFDFEAWKDQDRVDDVHDALKGYIDRTSKECPERGKVLANRLMKVSGGSKVDGDVTLPRQNDDGTGLKSGQDYTGTETILKSAQPMPGFAAPYDPDMATESKANFPPTTNTYDDDGKGDGDGDGDDGIVTTSTPQMLTPGPYKDVTVPFGQQLVLTSGTYYFKEHFDVNGEILIDASGGPVMVYVGEKMVVNGLMNENGKPRDLQVYFCDELTNPNYSASAPPRPTPTPAPNGSPPPLSLVTEEKQLISTLTMNSGARATMVTAGKHTKAKIDGARLLGAIVADFMDLNNAKVQYDKDLKSQNFYANCQWNLQGVHERSVGR